jgi:hypothetical protein
MVTWLLTRLISKSELGLLSLGLFSFTTIHSLNERRSEEHPGQRMKNFIAFQLLVSVGLSVWPPYSGLAGLLAQKPTGSCPACLAFSLALAIF